MDLGELIPIVAIIATACVIIAILNHLQVKHVRGGAQAGEAASDRENERLARENDALRRNVSRLEERMAVLERIATDPAERTAREIESLR